MKPESEVATRTRAGHPRFAFRFRFILHPSSFILWLAALLISCAVYAQPGPVPLAGAHAHNDYSHERPLLDALDHGFCSVEADFYLVDGKLLVAHDLDRTKPGRTLEALYLDPLRERVKANKGSVYQGGPQFWLLLDIKSDARQTYAALHEVLEQYADILTRFRGEKVTPRAVTAIVSGNCPRTTMARQKVRYAAVDGRPPHLDSDAPAGLIPWVSASWGSVFEWDGTGAFPPGEKAKLEDFVRKAHAKGRKVRFWALPAGRAGWSAAYEGGVDFINADDLQGLRDFLLEKQGGE